MTMVNERTRSVVETEGLLRELVRDSSLPDKIRQRAKALLRHYPAPDQIFLAGKLEERRRDELLELEKVVSTLPLALSIWLVNDPLFCDYRSNAGLEIS